MTAIVWTPPLVALQTLPTWRRRGSMDAMHPVTQSAELSTLLERVAGGDHDAFAAFYDQTSRVVFGIVLNVLRDRAQAEEVTQEVYVEAWKSAPRYDRTHGSASAWLNTIAHRRSVDRVRSAERSTKRDQRHFEFEAAVPAPDTSDIVVAHDEGRRVRNALQLLPEAQRAAVQLAYFEGRSHREVAEELNVPLGTVKTRIRDAMRRLRTNLEEASS